jgi:biotin/methionine sulfoxide reductase
MNKPDVRVTPFSTHWGTYYAEVEGGRLTGIRDYAEDPDPAVIGPGIIDMVDHPTRIRQPAIRRDYLKNGPSGDRSGRGREPFVAVPWDEALDIAAAEIDRVRREHGNSAIFGGSYGWASAGRFHHAQSHVHRFLNCAGGYTASIANYSYAAAYAIAPHVVGPFANLVLNNATSWPVIAEHTKLVVAFGGLAQKNSQVTSGGVGRHTMREGLLAARANGCEFVSVSPLRSDMIAELGAEWLPARPNTDVALMLGLAHTLLAEGLHDRAFLARYTTGWDRFEPYLTGALDGQPKDADWAAAITEIPAGTIRALARRMAGTRTMVTVSWSIQRADHGEQPIWMAVVLAAMLGQIGLPGGGFGVGYSSENGIGNPVLPFKFPAVPQGQNPVQAAIPVNRISDMLLNPGGTYDFDGERRTYPDIRLVYWTGGNPFHHQQDLHRLVRAFHRPETVIVNEIWWTPMARHADIVFPSTTALEREDIGMTHWEPLIVAMRQAIDPVAEARSDYEIFTGIARRMGLETAYTEGRSPEDWIRHLWDQTRQRAAESGFTLPTLEELRESGTAELPPNPSEPVLLADFRADPQVNPLTTPSGKIEIFSERIAGFGYDDCPGHPAWIEPAEWLGNARPGQLHLISNQPRTRLHSQFDPGRVSKASKVADREPITLNPADAAARGIAAGDVVLVRNERGACLAGAILSDAVRAGVVQLSTGAWFDPAEPGRPGTICKHGNPNVLTRNDGTSRLGQGPSAHTTLVEVVRYEGTPPPVTAHHPPALVSRDTI